MAQNPKKPPASINSESIAEQTEAFLKSGGQIQEIKTGVSGQSAPTGRRHITIGNNAKPAQ